MEFNTFNIDDAERNNREKSRKKRRLEAEQKKAIEDQEFHKKLELMESESEFFREENIGLITSKKQCNETESDYKNRLHSLRLSKASRLECNVWDGLPEDMPERLKEKRQALQPAKSLTRRSMPKELKAVFSGANLASFESKGRMQRCWAVNYFYERYESQLNKKTINQIAYILASYFKEKFNCDDFLPAERRRQDELIKSRQVYVTSYDKNKNGSKNGDFFCFEEYRDSYRERLANHKDGAPIDRYLASFPASEAQQLEAAGIAEADVGKICLLIETFIGEQYID